MREDGRGHGDHHDEKHPVRDTIGALALFAVTIFALVQCNARRADEPPKSTPPAAGAGQAATR